MYIQTKMENIKKNPTNIYSIEKSVSVDWDFFFKTSHKSIKKLILVDHIHFVVHLVTFTFMNKNDRYKRQDILFLLMLNYKLLHIYNVLFGIKTNIDIEHTLKPNPMTWKNNKYFSLLSILNRFEVEWTTFLFGKFVIITG